MSSFSTTVKKNSPTSDGSLLPPAPAVHIPPSVLGFSLLFWGWQTHLLAVGIPLALLLEMPGILQRRWEFSLLDYQRIWNGCLVLFLTSVLFAVGYSQALQEAGGAQGNETSWSDGTPISTQYAMLFFQWQPIVFAPFIIALRFSHSPALPATVFSWFARRHRNQLRLSGRMEPDWQISVEPFYFALTLISASTTNRRSVMFFIILALLVGAALWNHRSRRFPPWLILMFFLMTCTFGFAGHVALNQLQRYLTSMDATWFSRFGQGRTDPLESRTQIGQIGRLKLSGAIVLRISTTNELRADLLREASYDSYGKSTWFVGGTNRTSSLDWKAVSSEQEGSVWKFMLAPPPYALKISQYLGGGHGLLPLPNGPMILSNLPAGSIGRNSFGGVKVKEASSLVSYDVGYSLRSTLDRAPSERDLLVPSEEQDEVERIARALKLKETWAHQPTRALRSLAGLFRNSFRYSTYIDGPNPHNTLGTTALGYFLSIQKAGHCEFFATAATLILRAAGIPARYAVGYSIQELTGPGRYVVRDRHAHAWCLVWSEADQAWIDFDPTPPAWGQVESEHASRLEWLRDLGSRLWFEYNQWRAGRSEISRWISYAVGGVFVLLLVRFFIATPRRFKALRPDAKNAPLFKIGADSSFYKLEKQFSRRGWPRLPTETAFQWSNRVGGSLPPLADLLNRIVDLHYQVRFNPDCSPVLSATDLEREVGECLTLLKKLPKKSVAKNSQPPPTSTSRERSI